MNNKGADQSAQMRRLVCASVVLCVKYRSPYVEAHIIFKFQANSLSPGQSAHWEHYDLGPHFPNYFALTITASKNV